MKTSPIQGGGSEMLGRRVRLDVLPNAEELDAGRKLISKKSGIQSLHARGDSQRTRERTRRPAAEPALSVEAYDHNPANSGNQVEHRFPIEV